MKWARCFDCGQAFYGPVQLALAWAMWKTYLGRPETKQVRVNAMTELGSGLHAAKHHEDALTVQEAELSMRRRLGAPVQHILAVQANLSNTYSEMGRLEQALQMDKDIYRGRVKFNGEEDKNTLIAALNYADSLTSLERFEEAKTLLRKIMPVAPRVLGESHALTLKMRWNYAETLHFNPSATLDDLREAVTTLEDTERTARRVLGGEHPSGLRGHCGRLARRASSACRPRRWRRRVHP